MTQDTNTSATWRTKLTQLAASQATAQRALEAAQATATQVAFDGGDVSAAARLVQQHRDVLTALGGAEREARHRLEAAEAAEAEAAAEIERGKATAAMRARAVAAEKIDAALTQLGAAHTAFEAAGQLATVHFKAAGGGGPSHFKLRSPGALAGAIQYFAPTLATTLSLVRAEPSQRRPLAEHARALAGDREATE
jgi:hypothetical protein